MADTWLKSSQIKVYPSAYRGAGTYRGLKRSYNPESRLGIEENIVSLVQRLLNKDFFVVSGSSYKDAITFSIKGYLIKVEANSFSAGSKVYATIKLGPKNTTIDEEEKPFDYEYIALLSQASEASDVLDSEDGYFYGVKFSDLPSTDPDTYSFLLLDSEGNVPESSKFRLTTADIENVKDSETGKSIKEEIDTGNVSAENVEAAERSSSKELYADYMVERDGTKINKGTSSKSSDTTKVSPMVIKEGRYVDSNIQLNVKDGTNRERLSIATRTDSQSFPTAQDVEVKYADQAEQSKHADAINKPQGLIYNTGTNTTDRITNGSNNNILVMSSSKPTWKDPLSGVVVDSANYLKKGSTNEYYSLDFSLSGKTLTITYKKK